MLPYLHAPTVLSRSPAETPMRIPSCGFRWMQAQLVRVIEATAILRLRTNLPFTAIAAAWLWIPVIVISTSPHQAAAGEARHLAGPDCGRMSRTWKRISAELASVRWLIMQERRLSCAGPPGDVDKAGVLDGKTDAVRGGSGAGLSADPCHFQQHWRPLVS